MYCNDTFFSFGISISNLCYFCGKETESYPHLFMNCQEVNSIWKEVGEELKLTQLKSLEWKHILIGIDGKSGKGF